MEPAGWFNTTAPDLTGSLKLLDGGQKTPKKSLLRTSKSASQAFVTRLQAGDTPGSELNLSQGLQRTPREGGRKIPEWSFVQPGELRTVLNDSSWTGELLKEPNAGAAVADQLYIQFLEVLQAHGTEQQVLEAVASFEQICCDTLLLVKEVEKRTSRSSPEFSKVARWLQDESSTWRLLFCLYQDRLGRDDIEEGREQLETMVVTPARQLSEKELIVELYKSDVSVRECQLVIDWLERDAADQRTEEKIQHFTDPTTAWENTLHQLAVSNIPYTSSRAIVQHLDPDASLREGRPLHDLDMDDELRLAKEVFVEIRCGHLERAQALCVHCGQMWRAASLEGWRLYHDPNYDLIVSSSQTDKLPVEGNPNRDLWKLCAWRMADDVRLSVDARASHAAFCGHLGAIMALSHTWTDALWAHLRVLVDIRVEQELRANSTRSYLPMPAEYWKNRMSVEDVFAALAASKDKTVAAQAALPAHMVQQLLILDRCPELLECAERWATEKSCHPHLLRFLAHLVLFLRMVGYGGSGGAGDPVLEAYVKLLAERREPTLVAHYAATLPQEDQIRLYAQFLESVSEEEDRQLCLTAGVAAGLDVEAVTKRVVENIRARSHTQPLAGLGSQSTPDDWEKVSALDWVVVLPSQRAEALWQANAVVRHFLAAGKVDCARAAFAKVPDDAIKLVMEQFGATRVDAGDGPQLPAPVAASVHEYLCYKAYLDAQEGFSDWFQHYHHAKPQVPSLPTGEVTFTERVAYEHRVAQHHTDVERWKMAMAQQTKTVKSQLYNVLLFPEGGWLVDLVSEEENSRIQQLSNLRQLCIPKVVVLLVTVLQNMEQYQECLQLADLIASEQHQLYKVYSKQDLGELLTKLAESSLTLMDKAKDAWGHPVSSTSVTEKILRVDKLGKKFCSVEVSPSGQENVHIFSARLKNIEQNLVPLFYSITWHLGVPLLTKKHDLPPLKLALDMLKQDKQPQRDILLHLAATGLTKNDVLMVLTQAKEIGIRSIFALRGDRRSLEETIPGDFSHAIDLVKFIRKSFGDYFDICVAAYPQQHPESQSYQQDLQHLKEKVDAGANFIISQIIFEAKVFIKFVNDCRKSGITVPIIPGILPIQNYRQLVQLGEKCGTAVPDDVLEHLKAIQDDSDAVRAYGVHSTINTVRQIFSAHCTPGVHFFTMNGDMTILGKICEKLGLCKTTTTHFQCIKQAGI